MVTLSNFIPVVQVSPVHTPSAELSQGVQTNLDVRQGGNTTKSKNYTPEGIQTNLDFPHRQQGFRFPFPRPHVDFNKQIYRYLLREGLKELNSRFHSEIGHEIPSLEDLSTQFLEIIHEKGSKHIHPDLDTDGLEDPTGITYSNAERIANNAALAVLDYWDESYIPKKRAEGRKGGLTSKRPPKYTQDDLHRTQGLSKAQAALLLGCSESTISNLRRQQNAGHPVAPTAHKVHFE
ncbi:helix-turn-helix domain-containing protein [Cryobacterium sp. Hh7]|uniref:helix-turn-helix domain-containing protein n=1 Tax=Cryobacterium sp. Hh7 TaxID=1259159 RepID=UPI00106A96B2|nr:helix-turn-helix domain-containing protein [Cryobacterium sp. Hh7]TFD61196.1 helix-turn-helix domain-containing protein [Cryobacterium sp. Hh7]